MDPTPVKAGWKTVEFWTAGLASVGALLVLLNVLDNSQSADLQAAIAKAIQNGIAFISAATVVVATVRKLIDSRTQVKTSANKAIVSTNEVKLAAMAPLGRNVVALLLVGLFLVPSLLYGADLNLVLSGGKYYQVTKGADGKPTYAPLSVNVQDLDGTGPVVVVPPPPLPGPTNLTTAIREALANVTDYEKKNEDRKVIAFTLDKIGPAVARVTNAKEALATVKIACDTVLGSSAARWSPYWSRLEGSLNTTSGQALAADLATMSSELTKDLAGADEVSKDNPKEKTYGLDIARILEILKVIWPFIEMLLKNLSFYAQYIPVLV